MSAFVVADCGKNVFVWDVLVYPVRAFVVVDCEKKRSRVFCVSKLNCVCHLFGGFVLKFDCH